MTVEQIECFLAVFEECSFTKASKRLYTSQPQLSRQIVRLEEEVGLQLLERSPHYVRPTAAGIALYRELQGIPERIRFAVGQARNASAANTGKIVVGILEGQSVDCPRLSPMFAWMREHPNVEVIFQHSDYGYLHRGLERGEYQLILTLLWDEASDPDLNTLVLRQQTTTAVIGRCHPAYSEKMHGAEELDGLDFVVADEQTSPYGYQMFLKLCQDNQIHPSRIQKTRGYDTLLTMVEQGLACAILDQNLELERNSKLKLLSLSKCSPADVGLVWKKKAANLVTQSLLQSILEPNGTE